MIAAAAGPLPGAAFVVGALTFVLTWLVASALLGLGNTVGYHRLLTHRSFFPAGGQFYGRRNRHRRPRSSHPRTRVVTTTSEQDEQTEQTGALVFECARCACRLCRHDRPPGSAPSLARIDCGVMTDLGIDGQMHRRSDAISTMHFASCSAVPMRVGSTRRMAFNGMSGNWASSGS